MPEKKQAKVQLKMEKRMNAFLTAAVDEKKIE